MGNPALAEGREPRRGLRGRDWVAVCVGAGVCGLLAGFIVGLIRGNYNAGEEKNELVRLRADVLDLEQVRRETADRHKAATVRHQAELKRATKEIEILRKRVSRLTTQLLKATSDTSTTDETANEVTTAHGIKWYDMGRGFSYGNLWSQQGRIYTRITGEIKNRSDARYRWVMFDLTVYGVNNWLLGSETISIQNFEAGQTRPFNQLVDARSADIAVVKIQFSSGS